MRVNLMTPISEILPNDQLYWVYDGETFKVEVVNIFKQKEDDMTGQLFWVLLVKNPTKKEKDENELSNIVVEPTVVIAKDKEHAIAMSAKEWADKVDKTTEVVVVPFD